MVSWRTHWCVRGQACLPTLVFLYGNRYRDAPAAEPEILAVARLNKAHLVNEGELAVLIVDAYQHRGLGSELSRRLIEIARAEKLDRVTVEVLGASQPT
jgi:acetyltransferase